ncbi:hypothetical protein NEOLEDRAFT_1146992 [Neolentinus lepideus HHB14362 ss-1]|uniref:Uncharacterized protein n=1 Tax=Neolentinus lepideus HHB14362 ss-1 TaxID=1314782 RepID=A0A165THZ7_9AGAM|nr:hypothetical protein NEOLEDRAFT_1146992 [Neolentinus lepideus HHB14362 ss-1]
MNTREVDLIDLGSFNHRRRFSSLGVKKDPLERATRTYNPQESGDVPREEYMVARSSSLSYGLNSDSPDRRTAGRRGPRYVKPYTSLHGTLAPRTKHREQGVGHPNTVYSNDGGRPPLRSTPAGAHLSARQQKTENATLATPSESARAEICVVHICLVGFVGW